MTVRINKPALNLREKLTELDKPSGIAGEAMLRAETPQEQFDLIGAGRKNLIINGDFQVSQRGDYSSATTAVNNSYHLDRFYTGVGSGSTFDIQHTTVDLPNGKTTKACKLIATSTTISGYMALRHVIEDFRVLSNQTITVSAWVRTNVNGYTFRHDSTTNIGETFPATGNWEYVTATYNMPTITSAGRGTNQSTLAILNYNGSTGTGHTTGDYFEITQVQLELGKVATPFEHRSYGEELALCQRYFETGSLAFANQSVISGTFRVLKRATPTMVRTGSVYSGAEAGTFLPFSGESFYVTSGSTYIGGSWTADAEL